MNILTACTAGHACPAKRPSSRLSTGPGHRRRVQYIDVVQWDGLGEISESAKENEFGAIVH